VDQVYFHPLANTATTGLAPEDLLRFLRGLGHAVEIFDPEAAG
jgi:Ala-tRNA(Pro) deacylase